MKHFKVSFKQVDIIDNFVSEFSSLEVLNYNDTELTVSIKDKVNPGVNTPNGRTVMNNNSYRYIEMSVDRKGNVTNFNGYIQAGYGYEEFNEDSAFATPLYKKHHFTIDDVNLKVFDFLEKQKAV